jgi:thiamine-monophosphate kinase
MVSITAFGRVPPDEMLRRSRAEPGDRVVVSGTIGDAALGLAVLGGRVAMDDPAAREALIGRYRVPQPRVALGETVRKYARAAMDVSDGLAGDLAKLCAASGVSAVIDVTSVPLSAAVRGLIAQGKTNLEAAVSGGDDYEILCTVPEQRFEAFVRAAGIAGVEVTSIGAIVTGNVAPRWQNGKGETITFGRLSYSHF